MQREIKINIQTYNELLGRSSKLLFCQYVEIDNEQNSESQYKWESIELANKIAIPTYKFGNPSLGFCCCIIDYTKPKSSNEEESPILKIHDFWEGSISDWVEIINACIYNYYANSKNPYIFMPLIWVLDKHEWSRDFLAKVLNQYNRETQIFIVQQIKKTTEIYSLDKQSKLHYIYHIYNIDYEQCFTEDILNSTIYLHAENNNDNIYSKIENICNKCIENETLDSEILSKYPFIEFCLWLTDKRMNLSNIQIISQYYKFFSCENRLNIIKKYFYNISKGEIRFDSNLINSILQDENSIFVIARNCINQPACPIELTTALLCENVISLVQTNGNKFKEFNGILDLAYSLCDTNRPKIHIHFDKLFPTCNGGFIVNHNFCGFIDYSIIYQQFIEENKLSSTHIYQIIKTLFDKYSKRDSYYICGYDENNNVENCIEYCKKINNKEKLRCLVEKKYDFQWRIKELKSLPQLLQDILINKIPFIEEEFIISQDNISIENFIRYIQSIPQKYDTCEDGCFLIHSDDNSDDAFLVEQFYNKVRLRFTPQDYVIAGKEADVFGFWNSCYKEILMKNKVNGTNPQQIEIDEAEKQYKEIEHQEIKQRTLSSLSRILLQNENNIIDFVETEYSYQLLEEIKRTFYYKRRITNEDEKTNSTTFLRRGYRDDKWVCSPTVADKHNLAIDIPFFWCRGNECFHNCLENQTIKTCDNYQKYSIFHILEILGYPKLKVTSAGYEPDESVRVFLATVNRATKLFNRLICRKCEHLIFAISTHGLNRYSNFSCRNPQCSENNKRIYVSYCYSCKKGLIDSRDTAKCPNGWHICPTCYSCCDDPLFERLAQKYRLNGQQIPYGIQSKLGKGHNDKNLYYCPTCGTQIIDGNEHGDTFKWCPTCKDRKDIP